MLGGAEFKNVRVVQRCKRGDSLKVNNTKFQYTDYYEHRTSLTYIDVLKRISSAVNSMR